MRTSIAVAFQSDWGSAKRNMDATGGRRIDRKHVLMTATIISADGQSMAKILDLSPSGARRIACNLPLSADSDVIFRRDGTFAAARVAWTDGTCAGLEFYRQSDSSLAED
jgi:hypothetical protein